MLVYDSLMHHAARVYPNFTERPEGGFWDMIGYELCREASEPCFVGNHGSGYGFQQFRYEFDDICDQTPPYLSEEQALLSEYLQPADKVSKTIGAHLYL